MAYITLIANNGDMSDICSYCIENIVEENLRINGGTLLYRGAIKGADILILAYDNDEIVAFNALRIYEEGIYINQIAVKNTHKKKGIGREMMNRTIQFAEENSLDIYCHVREFNIPSQTLFTSLGFIKDEEESTSDNFLYKYATLKKANNR